MAARDSSAVKEDVVLLFVMSNWVRGGRRTLLVAMYSGGGRGEKGS